MHGKVTLMVLLICTFTVMAQEVTEDASIPPNHDIWKVSGSALQRVPQPAAKYEDALEWSFAIEKKEYAVGEPISGTLTVRNTKKDIDFILTAPYRGVFVDTIGIYLSAMDPKTNEWGIAYPLLRYNKGESPGKWPWSYAGPDMRIEHGSEYKAHIPVNTFQAAILSPTGSFLAANWLPAVGPNKQGRYRLYLRYVNMNRYGMSSVADDPTGKTIDPPQTPTLRLVGAQPVILGPYEFEIKATEREVDKAVAELASKFEPSFTDGKYRPQTLQTQQATMVLIDKILENHKEDGGPFRLFRLRSQVSLDPALPTREETLLKILRDIRKFNAKMSDEALKNAYALTECYVLYGLGKTKEAIDLAKKLKTPDAIVLVELWKRDESQVSSTRPQAESKPEVSKPEVSKP